MTQRLSVLLFILVVLIGTTLYAARSDLSQLWPATKNNSTPPPNLFPSPLAAATDQTPGSLTAAGVLAVTNQYRTQSNLPTLGLHSSLTQTAHYLLDDITKTQNFDPAGITSRDNTIVGANLISGNFADNAALVQALMSSPDHRANILNPTYTIIGLAVKPGTWQNEKTWLALQVFAQPLPAP